MVFILLLIALFERVIKRKPIEQKHYREKNQIFQGVEEHYSIYTKIFHKITTFPPAFKILCFFQQRSLSLTYLPKKV